MVEKGVGRRALQAERGRIITLVLRKKRVFPVAPHDPTVRHHRPSRTRLIVGGALNPSGLFLHLRAGIK